VKFLIDFAVGGVFGIVASLLFIAVVRIFNIELTVSPLVILVGFCVVSSMVINPISAKIKEKLDKSRQV